MTTRPSAPGSFDLSTTHAEVFPLLMVCKTYDSQPLQVVGVQYVQAGRSAITGL
jgi:hypothetical protein